MNYIEAMNYINTAKNSGHEPGLLRIKKLLEKLGDPQKGLKFVHIAGTNGKGSCAAMAASVMKTAGYKTGLFTSPYLHSFNERMRINGKIIENDALTELVQRVKAAADTMESCPGSFELTTAAALLWFAEEKCDIVVLEVGLGGRFDATNIIDKPEAAVIMNIGLDHCAILGDTVEKIAAEKAGIIKEGCPCVLYQQTPSVTEVIENVCKEKHSQLHICDFSKIELEFDSLYGQSFAYKGNAYALPLLGENQRKNSAVVIELAEVLREKGWNIPQEDLEHGIYAVIWPARFELVKDEPLFVVDGGHNPQCARTVVDNLGKYFGNYHHIMLVGLMADKDYESVMKILNLTADKFVCVSFDSERALEAEKLAEIAEKFGKPVKVFNNVKDGVGAALDWADSKEDMICAVGSLYLAGEVRECFDLR